MKKILLQMEDEVFMVIKQNLILKKVFGSLYSNIDKLVIIILVSIEKGKNEITIFKKEERL